MSRLAPVIDQARAELAANPRLRLGVWVIVAILAGYFAFVVQAGRTIVAIEVKSGRAPEALPGMAAFSEAFRPARTLLVGGDGIDVETFLTTPVRHWL
jgi:hypothetical protein